MFVRKRVMDSDGRIRNMFIDMVSEDVTMKSKYGIFLWEWGSTGRRGSSLDFPCSTGKAQWKPGQCKRYLIYIFNPYNTYQ